MNPHLETALAIVLIGWFGVLGYLIWNAPQPPAPDRLTLSVHARLQLNNEPSIDDKELATPGQYAEDHQPREADAK